MFLKSYTTEDDYGESYFKILIDKLKKLAFIMAHSCATK